MDQVFGEIEKLMEDRIHRRKNKNRSPAMASKKEEEKDDFSEEELSTLLEAYEAGKHAEKATPDTKWGAHMGGKIGPKLPAPEVFDNSGANDPVYDRGDEIRSKRRDEPDWEYVPEEDGETSAPVQKAMDELDRLEARPPEEIPGREPEHLTPQEEELLLNYLPDDMEVDDSAKKKLLQQMLTGQEMPAVLDPIQRAEQEDLWRRYSEEHFPITKEEEELGTEGPSIRRRR